MSSVRVGLDIDAPVERVWRALCDPAEVPRWDASVEAALDAPPDYPAPGQHVRWRCRSGVFRLLHDRPLEVVPMSRLRSMLALGPYRYDETYVLDQTAGGCRVTALVDAALPLPGLGWLIERLYLDRVARAAFEESLAGLKRWCEPTPGPDGRPGAPAPG